MYTKKGYPDVDEFVICTITRLTQYSAFVNLDEYENLEGMIYSSEMSRKLVRSMRVILKIGKRLVCKVLEVDQEKKQISLSIRWVGISQERTKLMEWNNEKRADDLLQVFAKMNNLTPKEVYAKIGNKVLDKYGLLYPAFEDIAKGNLALFEELKIEKEIGEKFLELLKTRITIKKSEIKGNLIMKTESPNGLDALKAAFALAREFASKQGAELEIKYIGAPKYQLALIMDDKKKSSQVIEQLVVLLEKEMKKNKGTVQFSRT